MSGETVPGRFKIGVLFPLLLKILTSPMGNQWKNWSGSVSAHPEAIHYPRSEAEVQELIRHAAAQGKQLRVVGAGHSFTPLVQTQQILVSLDQLSGLIEVDRKKRQASVWAGTRLKELGALLYAKGLAMENLGDIDVQSIAGAMSTGTHGTGVNYGTLATQMIGMTLVNGQGEIIELDPETTPDRFRAAQVSLGSLGIITRIRLRLEPAFKVRYTSGKADLWETLDRLEEYQQARHFEFYYFPFTSAIQTKVTEVSQDKVSRKGLMTWINDMAIENGLFWVLSKVSKHFRAHEGVSKLAAWGIPKGTNVSWSHQSFATQRLVKFQEMEYNIPAEHFKTVIAEVERTIREMRFRVHFPIECRWVKQDDIWLSPAYQRDSAYIAVHMYKGMPHEAYFGAMEGIFRKYGGRPHWGKMHHLSAAELRTLYPRFDDFQQIRQAMDPKGIFLNGYLKQLFGEVEEKSNAMEGVAKVVAG